MTPYEILLLLDLEVPEDRQVELVGRVRELVERGAGAWESHDVWGRRKLAYEIAHRSEGTYHLVTFDCDPATLEEISRVLKITDGVMRHMAVRRIQAGPSGPVAAAGASGQDELRTETTAEEGS